MELGLPFFFPFRVCAFEMTSLLFNDAVAPCTLEGFDGA